MACKACERRRKVLSERRAKAKERGRKAEAAAIGAVLAASEAAGKALGIHGEEPHVQDRDDARRNEGDQTSSGQP